MQHRLTVPLELKSLNRRQLAGHGSTFGNVDLGGDIVARGAFVDTLAEHEAAGRMPAMFWQHNPDKVPGRWDEMHEDDTGLAVKGTLARTPLGDELHVLAKMDAVRGLSIGYFPRDVDYDDEGVRIIKAVELIEVSIVSLAMNPLAQIEQTKARLSAAGEYVPTRREFERSLRDVGLSQKVAKKLVSAAFSGDPKRDVSDAEDEGILSIIELCEREARQAEIDAIKSLTRV